MARSHRAGLLLAGALLIAACGGGSSDSMADTKAKMETATPSQPSITELPPTSAPTTVPPTAPPETAPPETAPPPTAAPPPPASVMPDVVCMNLQEAQDTIQLTGVFYSRSFDATGQGRMQMVDSNWVVVSQDPPAGTPIVEGQANLGAVKYGEAAPC